MGYFNAEVPLGVVVRVVNKALNETSHPLKGTIVFAIKFTEANLPQILQTDNLSVSEAQAMRDVFITKDYVFIRGYYPEHGPAQAWAIMPWFFFRDIFEYDDINVQHNWDQIVRL